MPSKGRSTLSRELIAAAALQMIDEDGAEQLSMRRLGKRLGVEAMSLYHYVPSKDDVLDAVVELLLLEVEFPDMLPSQWETALRRSLTSFNDMLLRHPSAVQLIAARSGRSLRSLETIHWGWRNFVNAGLSKEQAVIAYRAIISFSLGFAATQHGVFGGPAGRDLPLDLGMVEKDEFVALGLANASLDPAEIFETGIDLIFASLHAGLLHDV